MITAALSEPAASTSAWAHQQMLTQYASGCMRAAASTCPERMVFYCSCCNPIGTLPSDGLLTQTNQQIEQWDKEGATCMSAWPGAC